MEEEDITIITEEVPHPLRIGVGMAAEEEEDGGAVASKVLETCSNPDQMFSNHLMAFPWI